MVVDMKKRSLA